MERAAIISELRNVHRVLAFDDSDDSASNAIAKVKELYEYMYVNVYNGGDRTEGNVLEALKYKGDRLVKFHYGTGGDFKMNSSSEILSRWTDIQINK